MQIVSNGDNLHEMSNSVFWEDKNISICRLLKILLRVLSVKQGLRKYISIKLLYFTIYN